MLCYKDKTFCSSQKCINVRCYRFLTADDEVRAAEMGLLILSRNYEDGCIDFNQVHLNKEHV